MFICFEGIDGCGKTTHIDYFSNQLSTISKNTIINTREPGGTSIGEQLRQILLENSNNLSVESEIMLAFSARKIHLEQVIQPALNNGNVLISDRFIDSTYAYQGYGKGNPQTIALIQQLHTTICNNLNPNYTILFDIEPELALERMQKRDAELKNSNKDNFEQRGLEFYTKVRNGYLVSSQNAYNQYTKYFIINADNTIENIRQQLSKIIKLISS